MGVAARIARRSLTGNPGRTAFSILGVAVGIATVVGVFTVDHVTVVLRTERLTPDFGADLEVRPRAQLEDPRAELLSMEGVAGIAAFFQNEVGFRPLESAGGDDVSETISLVGLEAGAASTLGVYYVEDGVDLVPATAQTGVLIGRSLAEDLAVGVGDRVVLAQPKKAARKKCVDGVFGEVEQGESASVLEHEEVFTVAGILAPEGLGRRASGRVAVIDYNRGRELLRDVFLESQFWLRRDASVELEQLESDLARSFTFERNETKAVGQMADERAFRNGVRMAGLFALLLGLFVIFHTLSMSLVQRVREVGDLHALGATRTQIASVFFLEAVVIALVAGALGLGGGIALAYALLQNGLTTLGMVGRPVEPLSVPWATVLPLVGLGVGMALVGSVFPILRARGTDVVSALRGEDAPKRPVAHGFHLFSILALVAIVPVVFFQVVPIVGAAESRLIGTLVVGLIVLGLLIGLPLMAPGLFGRVTSRIVAPLAGPFPLVGKLVSRTLASSPSRIGSSIAGIALVTAAFVGLKGMTNSLVGEIEVWGERGLAHKVWVENLPDLSFDEVSAALHALPEVRGVESRDARALPSFLLFGMRTEELVGYGPLAEGAQGAALAAGLRDAQTIILSGRLARERGLTLGDKVLMQTSGHGIQEFEVALITDEYGYFQHPDERSYGIVDEKHLRRFFCVSSDTTQSIGVAIDPSMNGRDAIALVEATLRARFPELERIALTDGDGILNEMREDLTADFVLFDVILALTALLAGLGVLNGQLLAALERRKEIGILRALGATGGQVAGAVLLESALIGVAGGLLGALVGTGLTPVLVSTLRILSDLPLPFRTAGAAIAFALFGALVLALVAGLYPIWRMNRFDDVRAVRTG